MKLNIDEWKELCQVFENRSYRYYDDEEEYKGTEEFQMYLNLSKRITASVQGSIQRFTLEQKKYLEDMLNSYQEFNCVDDIESYNICSNILKALKMK